MIEMTEIMDVSFRMIRNNLATFTFRLIIPLISANVKNQQKLVKIGLPDIIDDLNQRVPVTPRSE